MELVQILPYTRFHDIIFTCLRLLLYLRIMHFIMTLTFYSLMKAGLLISDFYFLDCSFEAGWDDIGFWYLLEMANINAQQPRMATKGKGREVSPLPGYHLIFYLATADIPKSDSDWYPGISSK